MLLFKFNSKLCDFSGTIDAKDSNVVKNTFAKKTNGIKIRASPIEFQENGGFLLEQGATMTFSGHVNLFSIGGLTVTILQDNVRTKLWGEGHSTVIYNTNNEWTISTGAHIYGGPSTISVPKGCGIYFKEHGTVQFTEERDIYVLIPKNELVLGKSIP